MWFSKHSLLLRCLVISTVVTIPSLCQAVPALNVQQTSYSVNAGSSILLQCSIASTSTTVTSVTWQRTVGNTVTTITSTTNTNKYSGSTTTQPSLTIFSTNSGDTGSYVCRATNSAGTGSSQTITLSVITSNVPTVTLPTLAYNVLQGGTITLDCTVSSTLTVTSVRWERNTLGAITPITSTTNTNKYSGSIPTVPTVTVQQPSYSVSTGGSVTLVCTVSSPNQAVTSVQWQRNVNGAITTITSTFNTNKYSGSTTTTPSLTIFSAAQSDVGTYTCFATNSVGTGHSSATTLSVTGTVPSVTIQQPSYSVTTGGSVTLVCTVTSNLAITNVQWQRNVNNVVTTITSNTNTNKYSGSTTTTPSLTIFNAAATDAGTYTCFGSNSVGTGQSTTTTLSVTGTVPSVTIQQPSYSVTTGGSVTLVCTVTSNLAITNVQWQRNVNNVVTTITSNTNTNKYSGSTTTTPSLTIFNAASSDAGTYTCFGSNSVGTGQSTTTTLSVTGNPPTVTVQQPSYSVTTGNSVTLVCTVTSNLAITNVQWQRNIGGSITTITSNTNTNKYSGSTTTTPSLTIFNAASSDAGTYTCFGSNSVGTGQSTTTTLSVTGTVPTVTVQQPSYSVSTGGSVTLVCTVSSPNQAVTSVQWQRNVNGAITTITSTFNTNKYSGSTTTTPSLTIFSAAQSDVGTYTCFATNSVGTGHSSATTLSVTGTVPSVTIQQPSYSVTTGGSVTLVCTVTSNLAITNVQWQRNVNNVVTTITSNTNTNKYSGSTTTTPSLTIFNAAATDAGTYTCFGSNSVGTGQSTTTTLSVTGTVPSVTIQQPSYSVTTGGSVTLVCTVTSNLAITNVQWQRNVNNVVTTITSNTNTNKYSGSTTTTPSLTIFNAASSDAGTYTCFGSNSVGTGQSTTTTLSVTGNPPTVTVQQPSYSVTTGNSVTLVCTVTSNLAITNVQWQRNIGGSITTITSNTNTNKYSGSTTTTPSLTIFNAASSDAGTYTCFGSNSVGTGQSTTTTLSVTGNLPTVTVQQPSYSVTSGNSVTLVCTVTSNLAITNVIWQRNIGGSITTITSNTNTNKYSGSTTTTPSLTIFNAASSDAGNYTCFGSNSVGTGQSTTTMLNVTGNLPTVTVQQPSYSVTSGNSVTLVCTVTSNLAITNVIWQRNIGGSITTITSNTNTNKYSGSTTTTPSLTIFNAASSDAGTYTCFGSNSVGTGQSTTTTLSVTGNPPTVNVSQPSYSAATGQSVTLTCTVTSNLPINSVYWQRNIGGSITQITSTFNTNKYSGSTTATPSLTIFSAAQSDAGTYTCFAANNVGTGQSSATTLSVTGNPPTVVIQQPSYSVTTGNSVTLVCSVTSNLAITNVQWQRNIGGSITTITSNTNTNKYSGSTATTPSLTIFNAASTDAGTYTCFGSNSVGPGQSTTTTLSVTGNREVTITVLTFDGKLYEDSVVKFVCLARLTGHVGNITTLWKLNNALIKPTSTSRWQVDTIPVNPQDPGMRQYHLQVNPLITADTGMITCQLSYGTKQTEKHINIIVLGKPTVSVSPMTSTAYQGDTIHITCTVIKSYSTNTSIVWYRNGVIFKSKAGIGDTGFLSDVLSISNIQGNLNVKCAAFNLAGEGKIISSVVKVIEPQACYKFCPNGDDAFNTTWKSTVGPTNVQIPCKEQYIGSITRYCNVDGIWEEPNYSACVREDLDVLRKQADYLKNGIEVVDVDSILTELTRVTSEENGDLTSGDLDVSSSILLNLADHAAESPDSLEIDQLEIFVSSCNNVLHNRNRPSWEQLTSLGYSGVTKLAESVTTYTKAYTNLNNTEFKRVVEKDNIVVEVGRTFSQNITLPDRNLTQSSWLSESASQITLQKPDINDNITLKYSSAFYRNISDLFHHYILPSGSSEAVNSSYDINSIIVEFSITPTPQKLVPPLVVEFSHLSVNFSNPVCGFWNFSIPNTPNGAWSTVGSRLVRSNDLSTVCEFDHTTNFAVLMSPGRTPVSHMLALSVISAVGCGISLLSLIVTLIVYGVLWRYMNSDRGKSDKAVDRAIILINLCTALIVSYVLFLAGIKQTGNKTTCTSIAVMLHYIFLVDFSLMLAEGVEIAFSVLHVFSTKSRIRWMLPICWFGPVIVVIISASITKLDGYGTPKFCWLSLDSGLLWAFAGPALLIIMINFVILVLVIRTSLRTHLMKEKSKAEKTKAEISNICVLLPLFGLTWVFGILSVNDESVVFQYLFAILNSLQGFFIFVVHCFLDKRVRKGIEHISRKRKSQQLDSSALFQRLKAPSSKNETSTSYLESTKSTSLQHHDSTIEVKTNHNEVTKEESKNHPESTKEWNESHDEATKEANNKLHVSTKEANKHQVSKDTNTNPNDSADDPSVNNIESNTETRLTENEKKDTTKIDNRTSQVLITDNRDIRTSARPGVNKKNYAKRDITFDDIDENNTASESKHGNKIQRLTSKTTKKRAVSQIKGSSKTSKTQRYSKETSIDTKTRIQSVRHPGTAPDFGDYPSYRSYHRGMWDVSPEEFYGYQQFGQTSSRNLYMPPFTDNKRRPNHRYGHNQPEFEWNAA